MAEDVTVFIFTCSYAGVYFPTVLAVIEESEHEPAAPVNNIHEAHVSIQ